MEVDYHCHRTTTKKSKNIFYQLSFFNFVFKESKAPAEVQPEEDIQLPDVPTDKIKGAAFLYILCLKLLTIWIGI